MHVADLYYDDGHVTIWHGDALTWLAEETDEALSHDDLLLTDPPYNHAVAYDGYGDNQDPESYARWCSEWFLMAREMTSSQIVFPGHGNLPMWLGHPQRPSAVGCWYKPGNPASSHLGWCEWEPWLYWGKRLGGSDTIRVPHVSNLNSDTAEHPCPKPVELVRRLLVKTKAETVLDPFMGTGTTLRAAKDLGITATGIEQSERYCEIAAKRMAQEVLDFGGVA